MSKNATPSPSFSKFSQRRLKLAKRLASFSFPEIFFLDSIETSLAETKVNQISISGIKLPLLSTNYCPNTSKLKQRILLNNIF